MNNLQKNLTALQDLATGKNGDRLRYHRPLMVNIVCPECNTLIQDTGEAIDFIYKNYCAACHEPLVNDWAENQARLTEELC